MTPAEFTKKVGVLYSMNRPGKRPMLGAVIRATDARAAKAVSLALLKRGRNPKGRGTVRLVPVYIGVPSVTDPRKFDITDAVNKASDELGALYAKHFSESE